MEVIDESRREPSDHGRALTLQLALPSSPFLYSLGILTREVFWDKSFLDHLSRGVLSQLAIDHPE
jgi:hypothetical protein